MKSVGLCHETHFCFSKLLACLLYKIDHYKQREIIFFLVNCEDSGAGSKNLWAGSELPTPSCDSSLQYYHVQNIAFEIIILYSLCVKHVSSSGDAALSEKAINH